MQRFTILPLFHNLLNSLKCDIAKNYHTLQNRLFLQHCKTFFKSYSESALKCWNCGTVRTTDALLCTQCNLLQKPHDTSNYFAVLNVEQTFDIDPKSLTNKYRQLQAVLHPDKYSNKSQAERDISLTYSSLVNNAYNTLQVPLKRAIHLLKLYGVNIDQEVTHPEFLTLIMELNEEVEAAKTPEDLKNLDRKNKTEMEKINSTLSSCFKQQKLRQVKDEIIKMKYYNSIRMRINELLRDRGIVE
ncbi:hypothetical protein RN001_010379 [Aquatica leii]|uniref:J domain-containing protein n=1 Tax=Aquatica leii TaxID=1421715 RepID=A0AAN7SNA3_9COLE|nr:hypothetical protein RN001_010379 [Aquatica leii]